MLCSTSKPIPIDSGGWFTELEASALVMGQVGTIRFLEENRREECFLISDAFLSLSMSTDGVGISDKIMWPLSLCKKQS